MKTKNVIVTSLIGLSCILFAGCKPSETSTQTPESSPIEEADVPPTQPGTAQVQSESCGTISVDSVSKNTGVKVGPPSVTAIESATGSKRYSCTFNRADKPSEPVLTVDITFKKDSPPEAFTQLWENQKKSQEKNYMKVVQVGKDSFLGQVDKQPALFFVNDDAQYVLKMSKSSASPDRVYTILVDIGTSVLPVKAH